MSEQLAPPTMDTMRFREITAVYKTVDCPNVPQIKTSRDVYDLLGEELAPQTKEYFICLHLDTKNRIICRDVVSIGSLNATVVHPREVYKAALLSSAAAVVFVHNHPSGDVTPSPEDINMTDRLRQAGEVLGIRVLDHVIIGHGDFKSFADQGIL